MAHDGLWLYYWNRNRFTLVVMDKYTKALEQARNYYPDNLFLDTIFPELAESEDERIRKALLEMFNGMHSATFPLRGISREQYIAWLEKQKEQKFTHHQIDESLQDAVTHQMEDDGDVDDFVRKGIDDIALKYAELGARWQKEQKPIFRVGDTMRTWDEAKRGIKDGLPHIISINSTDYLCNNEAIRISEQGDYEFPPMNREQPAEWSEEDKNMLNSIIATCQLAAQDRDSGPARHLLGMQERFLKSLRPQPHWKPSEKQMNALKHAYSMMGGQAGTDLANLYYDLKKL